MSNAVFQNSGAGSSLRKVGVGPGIAEPYMNIQSNFDGQDSAANPWWTFVGGPNYTSWMLRLGTGDKAYMNLEAGGLPNTDITGGNPQLQFDDGKDFVAEWQAYTYDTADAGGFVGCNQLDNASNITLGSNLLAVGFLLDGSDFYAHVGDGAAETSTAISLPATGSHTFRIEYDFDATTVTYKIDGVTVATINTNVPTANSNEVGFMIWNDNNTGNELMDWCGVPSFSVEV